MRRFRNPAAKGRRDANHGRIVRALQRVGTEVVDLGGVGRGVPDLLTCRQGVIRLLEIKTEKGRNGTSQNEFRTRGWPVSVVRNEEEALMAVGVPWDLS